MGLWYHFNRHLAHVIAHINPAALDHSCDMGYATPATLRFFVEDYLRHVRHHIEQILGDSAYFPQVNASISPPTDHATRSLLDPS